MVSKLIVTADNILKQGTSYKMSTKEREQKTSKSKKCVNLLKGVDWHMRFKISCRRHKKCKSTFSMHLTLLKGFYYIRIPNLSGSVEYKGTISRIYQLLI